MRSVKTTWSSGLPLWQIFISKRRRSVIFILGLVIFSSPFILIKMFSMGRYTQQTSTVNQDESVMHQVHEFHWLGNVSVPLTKQDALVRGQQTVMPQNMKTNEPKRHSVLKVPAADVNSIFNKKLDRPTIRASAIYSDITLKPNFTTLINASQPVVTVNAAFILENPKLCSSVKNLAIMTIVLSSPDHASRRFAIRNTWANGGFYRHLGNLKILFLLGKTKDSKVQAEIENEFNRYGDILQGDFIDDYYNLTLKDVMAFKWLTERCRTANLILKVDDDISVNTFKLWTDYYPKYQSLNKTIICNHILTGTKVIRRNNDSKYYVNNNHFRGLDFYPTDYCSGFFVLFTNDLLPALYRSAKITPFFWIEDVYSYGLVPGNVPGVKYIGLTGNWYQLSGQEALKCYKNETATCPLLVAGAGAVGEMEELWPHMFKRYVQGLQR